MTIEPKFDLDTEWLQLAPPVGLVVSSLALNEANLVATRQTNTSRMRTVSRPS
jgi:hypothetical protein